MALLAHPNLFKASSTLEQIYISCSTLSLGLFWIRATPLLHPIQFIVNLVCFTEPLLHRRIRSWLGISSTEIIQSKERSFQQVAMILWSTTTSEIVTSTTGEQERKARRSTGKTVTERSGPPGVENALLPCLDDCAPLKIWLSSYA